MGKLEFDFREGLDKDNIIYKRKGFDWKHCIYYFGYLFFAWGYTVAFFALFQFAYVNHEPVAFPIYIALWLAFMIALIVVAAVNLVNYGKQKKIKQARKAAEKQRLEQHAHGLEHMPTNVEMVNQRRDEKDTLVS
jgi:hypothetical protein